MSNTPQIPYDGNDIDSMRLCGWREARGEGPDGIRAVMHVLLNRAVRWYGAHSESIHTAIYAKNQFTSMSVPTDPEYHLMPAPDDPLYASLADMAVEVLDGSDDDLTNGALYYVNPHTMTSGWFRDNIIDQPATHPETARIGHHIFFA